MSRDAYRHYSSLATRRPAGLLKALGQEDACAALARYVTTSYGPALSPGDSAKLAQALLARRWALLQDTVDELEQLRSERRHFDEQLAQALELLKRMDEAASARQAAQPAAQ